MLDIAKHKPCVIWHSTSTRRGSPGAIRQGIFLSSMALMVMTTMIERCQVASVGGSLAAVIRKGKTCTTISKSSRLSGLLVLRGGELDLSKSWKQLVNASQEIPYDIMASPLTTDEEIARLQSHRKLKMAEELRELQKPAKPWSPVERPPPGPNGTYGAPDLTGTRWKALKSGEGKCPYPRVPLRYKMNSSMADMDPYMLWLKRANVSADDDMHVDDWSMSNEDDELGNLANLPQSINWRPPVPNMTIGPWPENEDGYIIDEYPVSPNWRPYTKEASIQLPTSTVVAAFGDNRAGQIGLGPPQRKFNGSIPVFLRDNWFGFQDNGWPVDTWERDEEFSERIPMSLDEAIGREFKILSVAAGWNHVMALVQGPRGTEVLAWGFNKEGQLGLGHCNNAHRPTSVESLANVKIKQIACGQAHSLVLLEDGRVLACGSHEFGQLGIGGEIIEDPDEPPLRPSFTLVEGLRDWFVTYIACGDYHSIFVARHRDQIHKSAGKSASNEKEMGAREGLTECDLGDTMLGCGLNCCGQLALNHSNDTSLPERVLFDGNVAGLRALVCGSEHTVAVDEDGQAWTWGRNDKGQLGVARHPFEVHPEKCECLVPTRVVFDRTQHGRVAQVACGRAHTVLLMEDGQVWGAGHNRYTQLGLVHACNAYMFTPLTSTPSWKYWKNASYVRQICTGEENTFVLTHDWEVLGCGNNNYGELGTGNDKRMNMPTPVAALPPGKWKIACSSRTTYVYKPWHDKFAECDYTDEGLGKQDRPRVLSGR